MMRLGLNGRGVGFWGGGIILGNRLLVVDGDSRGVRSGGRVDRVVRVVRGSAGDPRTIGRGEPVD